MLPVIHFTDFESFLDEVRGSTIIRCKILQTSVPGSTRFLRDVTVSLRLGAIQDGCILSYLAYQRVIEMVEAGPKGRLEEAWNKAVEVEKAVRFAVDRCGGVLRAGVIDLGSATPIAGTFVVPLFLNRDVDIVIDADEQNRIKAVA